VRVAVIHEDRRGAVSCEPAGLSGLWTSAARCAACPCYGLRAAKKQARGKARMPSDNTCVRILQRALQLLGGETELAAALHVSRDVLSKWLAGEVRPTTKAYFTALDLVTTHLEKNRRVARR
jgi:hypothetical protein